MLNNGFNFSIAQDHSINEIYKIWNYEDNYQYIHLVPIVTVQLSDYTKN